MTIPPIFDRLIDDAAVFPPGSLPLPAAVAAHRDHRSSWYAGLTGPLLTPSSALDELSLLVRDQPEPLDVAVVVDTGTGGVLTAADTVANDSQLVLRGVEVPLRGEPLGENARRAVAALDAALGGPDDDEPAYVEVPRRPGWETALDIIAESGYRAKLRTGGAGPDTVPSPADVAGFVLACLDRGIAMKFTAGLHHAVRAERSGVVEHGFLNLLLAVATALDGGSAADVESVVSIDDGTRLATRIGELDAPRAASVRRWFASYGSCSIAEPLDELIALGLVTGPGEVTR